jgi:hypothetical protein
LNFLFFFFWQHQGLNSGPHSWATSPALMAFLLIERHMGE